MTYQTENNWKDQSFTEPSRELVDTMDKRNSIRIGLVGCVSCGKSTLLNSICVNQYEEMKNKRTTMLPSVYRETNQVIHNSVKDILEKNQENNQNIFSGEVKLNHENCQLVENMIPRINNFTKLPPNIYLDIYDIPGLNDAETKDIYYKWIEDNFSELDIIIHIIDINSPLNTSDQIDILKMLIKNIHDEKVKNGREVLLLTVVNKCDEMEQDDDLKFIMDTEDQENYDNIIKTTYEKITEVIGVESPETVPVNTDESIKDNEPRLDSSTIRCEFTQLSAADTFVYRMLHNNPNVKMDMKLLQKFGVNEVGRRAWNKKTEQQRREMITEHFSYVDIRDTLEITGYNQFTSILNKYLTKKKQSTILVNRIKQELSNEELINKNLSTDKGEVKKLIDIYNSYSSKVWVVDQLYQTNNSHIVTDLINKHLSRWINQISDISNESEESIKRLQEYKGIILELSGSIDTYALLNPVPMVIDEDKKKRWSDSLGINADIVYDVCHQSGLTIKNTLKHLFGGYSKLQNEYYIKNLENISTYQTDFPKKVFENIDALRENACDSVESTIDGVINYINHRIAVAPAAAIDWSQDGDTPMSGYYEVDGCNTTVQFCKTLIESYNYPKEKIIDFIKNYINNRCRFSFLELGSHVKSYTILFDSWIEREAVPESLDYDYYKYLRNIHIINKSYMHESNNLDPSINYYEYENKILAIPMYLHSLIVTDIEQDSDCECVFSSPSVTRT
jgi:GTPase Era involved in 16S rRNA processing